VPFLDLSAWPLWQVVTLFAASAVVIAVAGTHMTQRADRLADLTGMGEAIFGAVLLGGSTSLPGIMTSVTTAFEGYAELAISNAIGGIAAQTTFLAVADMAYHRANLEHAAASVENLTQGALLTTLLAIPLLATSGPDVTVLGIHPASVLLLVAYLFGLRLVQRARSTPLWKPYDTPETRPDEPDEHTTGQRDLIQLWATFIALALLTATAGYVVAQSGITLANRTGLSETVVGGLFTAIATSLPELVTSVAAVRQGALTLAVGGVIGGNAFDVLFVAFSDAAYRAGSIYHAITDRQVFVIALTLLLTGVLLLGLLRRERSGIMGIGFESFLVIVLYLGAFGLLFVAG
jgi:cation:H+ antiporter